MSFVSSIHVPLNGFCNFAACILSCLLGHFATLINVKKKK